MSLGVWKTNLDVNVTCQEDAEEISGYYAQFFYPYNSACDDLAGSCVFLLLVRWFLKTCDIMFLEWERLFFLFIFQLCYTRTVLGWIRYSMALTVRTRWNSMKWPVFHRHLPSIKCQTRRFVISWEGEHLKNCDCSEQAEVKGGWGDVKCF